MNHNILKKKVVMGRFAKIALLLVSVLVMSGCVNIKKSAVTFDYYTLEYEVPFTEPVTESLPVVLHIERFTAAPEYETNRIVFRDSFNKRSSYYYHKWRALPSDLVTFFLKRDLAESGLFAGVLPPESAASSTHVLDGMVEEFLEWDTDSSCEAVMTVNIILLDARETDATQSVVLQDRFTAREKCEAKEPAQVARAMSQAMAKLSIIIGAVLQEAMQNNL